MTGISTTAHSLFILGGARSGKSRFAQELAAGTDEVLFVATGQPLDSEMAERIAGHRLSRPENWRTLEAPFGLAEALSKSPVNERLVIIDCLTLLVSNILGSMPDLKGSEERVLAEIESLMDYVKSAGPRFIIVSNEVGLGIVPENDLARLYRDLLGKANQVVAARVDEVYFMAAGLPLKIK
jgi:adenosylcobinamide kinase/adenosylcobinamide-phosphate guanylyltransferase